MSEEIPQTPKLEKIEDGGIQRINEWISYFKNLSDRILVIEDNGLNNISNWLAIAQMMTMRMNDLEPHQKGNLLGWPDASEVAFIIKVNTSMAGREPKYPEDFWRIFCIGNFAFSPGYFEWCGDAETDPDNPNYSLGGFSDSALSWEYVTSLIKNQLKELSKAIPEFPNELRRQTTEN